ncbi:cytochrome P450 [Telmatospirillum sp. J64-1]|uniref:cytochrome P450 n=1 Tax=Telmatospirillum sp. J64-1 TaxID=2502183 RepID=UPI00115CAC75|nr:cytochrome P450 [Telmatospirillum sp. J64-1]
MSQIPRDTAFDSTLALLSEAYRFIPNRCRRYRSDLFETRLMLQKAVCMSGEDAARVFYDGDRFTRQRAMPPTTLMLLQDLGSVQMLDGEDHRWRKRMFMSLMTPDSIRRLGELASEEARLSLKEWERKGEVVLHEEMQDILCRAVCRWAGLSMSLPESREKAREFGAMIDGAGAVGPRNWKGMRLRNRTERWARGRIEGIRAGKVRVTEDSPAAVIAAHRDRQGRLLDVAAAAVELLNLLRPTVAVARFVVFAALALHDHPGWRTRLAEGDEQDLEHFVQEVRRFYPFFPFIAGRAREAFDWRGYHFVKDRWVILDIYGTHHDPRVWSEPDLFQPDRFRDWNGSAFSLIPQGGGDHYSGHRCPGEWFTIDLMKRMIRLLVRDMDYDVPQQDLSIDLSRMPTIPKSRFRIAHVRPRVAM